MWSDQCYVIFFCLVLNLLQSIQVETRNNTKFERINSTQNRMEACEEFKDETRTNCTKSTRKT